jgi:hypothetical protein
MTCRCARAESKELMRDVAVHAKRADERRGTSRSVSSRRSASPPESSFRSRTRPGHLIDDAGLSGAVHSHAGLDGAFDRRVAFLPAVGDAVGGADVDGGVVAYGGFACVCYGSGDDMGSAASVSSSLLRTGDR